MQTKSTLTSRVFGPLPRVLCERSNNASEIGPLCITNLRAIPLDPVCGRLLGRPQPWGSQKKVRDRLVSCLRCNLCVPIRKIRGETGLKPPRFHPLGSILGDIKLNGFIARTHISSPCGATTLERHRSPQLAGGGLVGHCHVCCKRLQLRLCSISTSQGCEMR